ncbi:MAG: DUF378 domain-containing protein [Candidatus Gottesmanbacteria bacterium]|nr:DUF378 domain-containing protein [Candidatus Gottesmanbacteria bacterium]
MKLKTVSKWLVILGAIEVGLMGVMNFDFIGSLLGGNLVGVFYPLRMSSRDSGLAKIVDESNEWTRSIFWHFSKDRVCRIVIDTNVLYRPE